MTLGAYQMRYGDYSTASPLFPSSTKVNDNGYPINARGQRVTSPAELRDDRKTTASRGAETLSASAECQTCASRTYQDGSNDPGVSFKSPGKIDPASSYAVVSAHEGEHVARAMADDASGKNRLLSVSVNLESAVCSECGRSYVSGGTTRTVTTSAKSAEKPAVGGNFDASA